MVHVSGWAGFAQTVEPLLFADLLFFAAAPGAIWWLARKAPRVSTIAPAAPGSSTWDWITLGALFASACVLLIGTLYINRQGTLHLFENRRAISLDNLPLLKVSPLVITDGAKPPPGAIVLSSNSDCQNCEVIKKYLQYELYKAK